MELVVAAVDEIEGGVAGGAGDVEGVGLGDDIVLGAVHHEDRRAQDGDGADHVVLKRVVEEAAADAAARAVAPALGLEGADLLGVSIRDGGWVANGGQGRDDHHALVTGGGEQGHGAAHARAEEADPCHAQLALQPVDRGIEILDGVRVAHVEERALRLTAASEIEAQERHLMALELRGQAGVLHAVLAGEHAVAAHHGAAIGLAMEDAHELFAPAIHELDALHLTRLAETRPDLANVAALMRLTALCLLFVLAACSGSTEKSAPKAGAPSSKEAYWKKAFPTGDKFDRKGIAKDQLAEADYGNNIYIEVSDAEGKRLGYLRDFVGPVSTKETCACDPLNVTLVFDADGQFTTLLSPQPLTKKDHVELTKAETERLIELLRDPPAALLEVRDVEDVVDATSGATKPEYKPMVIEYAALETQRLVHLVMDTSLIIAGAPLADDQKQLAAVLAKPESIERARELAALLDRLTSDVIAQRAYVMMSRDYLATIAKSNTPDEAIDAKILDNAIADRVGPGMQAEICYRLAEQKAALTVAERCAQSLARYQDAAPIVALIQGTVAFYRDELELASKALEAASWRFDVQTDPMMHARLAAALVGQGQTDKGCTKALLVRRAHPLMPENKTTLEKCAKVDKGFNAKLAAAEKEDRELFMGLKQDGATIPTIDVDDAKLQPVKLAAGEPGKITVMMFFATWCPHCQAELPKVTAFAEHVAKDATLKNKVRVLGVRTAIEREAEPYEAFQQRFKIGFPIYTDTAMSTSYQKVVQDAGLKGGFPTLIVTDEKGKLRFEMPAGEFRDTEKELEWAVKSLTK